LYYKLPSYFASHDLGDCMLRWMLQLALPASVLHNSHVGMQYRCCAQWAAHVLPTLFFGLPVFFWLQGEA
jgi:hypothetical protein